jgi:hypothetical protein
MRRDRAAGPAVVQGGLGRGVCVTLCSKQTAATWRKSDCLISKSSTTTSKIMSAADGLREGGAHDDAAGECRDVGGEQEALAHKLVKTSPSARRGSSQTPRRRTFAPARTSVHAPRSALQVLTSKEQAREGQRTMQPRRSSADDVAANLAAAEDGDHDVVRRKYARLRPQSRRRHHCCELVVLLGRLRSRVRASVARARASAARQRTAVVGSGENQPEERVPRRREPRVFSRQHWREGVAGCPS